MPHVKGNKFKPKAAQPPAALDTDTPSTVRALASGRCKGKKRRWEGVGGATAGSVVAVKEAVPGAANAAHDAPAPHEGAEGAPSSCKKRRRGAAHLQLPPIPTVVAPVPKPGAAAAAAVTSSNWVALKAAMDATKQQHGRPQRWQSQPQRKRDEGSRAAVGAAPQSVPVNRPASIGKDTAPTKARQARVAQQLVV